ncbi:hypothetical protein [Synechococcus sp. PCC 6312]|uniref:hypothetical protein n=1 Tax=Synechococcus sp. (strain ATCC 27167 / PCC 6312) TaxID=195253 RepID=UPI00029ECEF9|nr:hypothetical protein [Synechococcus sp. PCC 6312]AFY59341.1 hypothetical protein Syn6312_0087 [Synechococcus sp. PCC 6312]
MTVVYQSRFLRFWRVQVHRWQHHWQIQHRRWQTSFKWTVQAWVYPLYRLVQLNQWLPRGLKQGLKQQWQALQAQAEPQPPPASDTPIVNLLHSLDSPGLTLIHADGVAAPQFILHPPQPKPRSPLDQAWAQLTSLGITGWQTLQTWFHPLESPQLTTTPDPLLLAPSLASPPLKPIIPLQAWWQWFQTQSAKIRSVRPVVPIPPASPGTSALATQTTSLDLTTTELPEHLTRSSGSQGWAWVKTAATQISQKVSQTTLGLWQKRDHLTRPKTLTAALTPQASEIQLRNASDLEAWPTGNLVSPKIEIHGIASQLANQDLVLVGSENQIFDILTPQQQQQLRERILWELAGYYYQLRQWQHLTGQSLAKWGLATSTTVSLDPAPPNPPRPHVSLLPQLGRSPLPFHRLWDQFQAWLLGWPPRSREAQSLIIPEAPVRAICQNPTQFISPLSGSHTPKLANPTQSPGLTATHPFTLDIDSTFLGYEPQGLEMIWLWLDRLFLWIERAWAWLWGLGPKLGNLG